MDDAVEQWRREQINSRPTARRKIAKVESDRAEARWKKDERIDAWLKGTTYVSLGVISVVLAIFAVWATVTYLSSRESSTTSTLSPTPSSTTPATVTFSTTNAAKTLRVRDWSCTTAHEHKYVFEKANSVWLCNAPGWTQENEWR